MYEKIAIWRTALRFLLQVWVGAETSHGACRQQTIGYDVNQFKGTEKDLTVRLNREVELTIKLINDSRELESALMARLFGTKVSPLPGDEIEPLKEYRAKAEAGRAALKARRAKLDEIIEDAKDLMVKGKAAMDAAQSQVRCR
ncbi:MAG TPA: hypothetical protein VIE65_16815 [Methylobacter sp.]|jgi:hypothetical protein